MLSVGAVWFAGSQAALIEARAQFSEPHKAAHLVSVRDWEWLDEHLLHYFEGMVLQETEMAVCKTMCADLETIYRIGGLTHAGMRDRIEALTRCWESELQTLTLIQIESSHKKFYAPKQPLFGADFAARFPSAAFDLDESAKCLALGRHTASVFHLMRLMEIGIKATSKCLGAPDPVKPAERNWGVILKKIDDAICAKWPTAATKMAGDGAFFESVLATLESVKNPWRNATMHVENKYTAEEAEHIFVAVRGFLMKLSLRCDENGEPLA